MLIPRREAVRAPGSCRIGTLTVFVQAAGSAWPEVCARGIWLPLAAILCAVAAGAHCLAGAPTLNRVQGERNA